MNPNGKIEKAVLSAVTLADGALSDANITQVDFNSLPVCREFVLSARITPNTTAPGATKWIAINWYWSDENIATSSVTALLAARKHTSGPMVLPNSTLAGGGEQIVRIRPALTIPTLTTTASTTTATLTFPPNQFPPLNVGDLVTVSGGTVGGDGDKMQGTYALASVTQTSGANGQLVNTATYTITSSTGTLVGATVQIVRTRRIGGNDLAVDYIFRPTSRYLYFSVDRPALTTNATTTLTLNIVRVPSANPDLV